MTARGLSRQLQSQGAPDLSQQLQSQGTLRDCTPNCALLFCFCFGCFLFALLLNFSAANGVLGLHVATRSFHSQIANPTRGHPRGAWYDPNVGANEG